MFHGLPSRCAARTATSELKNDPRDDGTVGNARYSRFVRAKRPLREQKLDRPALLGARRRIAGAIQEGSTALGQLLRDILLFGFEVGPTGQVDMPSEATVSIELKAKTVDLSCG